MKHKFLLTLAATALLTVVGFAQGVTTGKIHGSVTDPTGTPRGTGVIGLTTDGGHTYKYTFQVAAGGTYSGADIAPGTYTVIYRMPDTPEGKFLDELEEVKIVAGQDAIANIDMSREEFIKKLSPEQQKQVEEFRKKNDAVMKGNAMVKLLNTDLATARQDNKDKKYAEAEELMLKDTAMRNDAVLLWYELGSAQIGLKKYPDAITTFKKVLDIYTEQKKPNPELEGGAHAGLGEAYARDGKPEDVANAQAEYDAAAKANPTKAGFYYSNETVVFQNVGNSDAQAASADKAITADPKNALPYYLKGQALAGKITQDAKTKQWVLPTGLADAYNTYLKLAPTGPYAPEVTAIMKELTTPVKTTYKAK